MCIEQFGNFQLNNYSNFLIYEELNSAENCEKMINDSVFLLFSTSKDENKKIYTFAHLFQKHLVAEAMKHLLCKQCSTQECTF